MTEFKAMTYLGLWGGMLSWLGTLGWIPLFPPVLA